jgi:hypothetical protein
MNKRIVIGSLFLVSIMSILSGCAKSVTCKSSDNSEIRVSVLEDSLDPMIVTNRWNPFVGSWFNDDITSGKPTSHSRNIITANMTTPAAFTILGAQRIILNGDDDTVYLGEDSYKCNNDLSVLTTLVKKINSAKMDDRIRHLEADIHNGRY